MNTKVLLKGPPPPRGEPIKYRRWGEGLEEEAVMQMDRAWAQLGTSGSGNHFVEFGLFTAHEAIRGLEPGTYQGHPSGHGGPERSGRHSGPV